MSDIANTETDLQEGDAELSRPYAKAVYEMAKGGDYKAWSEKLELMAAVSRDETLRKVLDDPRLTRDATADLFIKACGDDIGAAERNLLSMLAENNRLNQLPMIAAQFANFRDEAEGVVEAQVVSAMVLSDDQKSAIIAALKKRLGREVQLNCSVDEALVGGAIIRAGDLVIDGSATEYLRQLSSSLIH
ncbi:MAG: F0F1 ATP synthase subunit delta [Gammaproteobacteria bacterium]